MDLSGLQTQSAQSGLSKYETQRLRDASEKLEANFLALMLKESGLGKTPDFGGGGEGEDQVRLIPRRSAGPKDRRGWRHRPR